MRKLAALALLIAIVGGVGFWFIQGWNGAGPARSPVDVVIPRGASLPRSAEILKQAGAISSTSRFLFQAKLLGGGAGIKAGEYEIPPHSSNGQILALLRSGKTLQRLVTIPEGLPSILVWERLSAAPALV